jgi:Tfp pilus assembly protein PilO/Tfp pilus assembly protein PilP
MTLTIPYLPPWLERLGIPLASGGLILGLGWYLFVSGYSADIELQRQQLNALSRELGPGAELKQQLQDRKSRNRKLASRLQSLEASLPEEETATGLLSQLQQAAVESGLKVKGIGKRPGQEGETFSLRRHGLVLAGAYHDLGGFCGKLAGLDPIVNLEDLRISAAGPEPSPHTLSAELTAVLHIYQPSAPAVGAPLDPSAPARRTPYGYRAKGRRDPFGLPRAPASPPPSAPSVVRPLGLKGQRVSELRLVGLVKAGGEFTALATGLRDRSFLLRKGDRLFDGKVLEVRADRVIFARRVDGGAGRTRTVRVVKKLYPAPVEVSDER